MNTTKSMMRIKRFKNSLTTVAMLVLVAAAMPSAKAQSSDAPQRDLQNRLLKIKIQHVIVIYQENWSFDSLYGQFPGANGLQNGFDTLPQLDKTTGYSSYVYATPQPLNGGPDLRFP